MTDAGALPFVVLTAWQVLVERAQVKPGKKVLVHAVSGGVGTVAIQFAKQRGAAIATTSGSRRWGRADRFGANPASTLA